MIKRNVMLVFMVFPFLLNAFCFSVHYEGQYNEYRKIRIADKIHYLSGKCYPKVVDAIFNHVDPCLDNAVISIIWKESRFKTNVTSDRYWGHYRDYGLMQISSYFWKFDPDLIFNEDYNVLIGYGIYKSFLESQNGNLWYSFKRYNGSAEYANSVMRIYCRLMTHFGDKIC